MIQLDLKTDFRPPFYSAAVDLGIDTHGLEKEFLHAAEIAFATTNVVITSQGQRHLSAYRY